MTCQVKPNDDHQLDIPAAPARYFHCIPTENNPRDVEPLPNIRQWHLKRVVFHLTIRSSEDLRDVFSSADSPKSDAPTSVKVEDEQQSQRASRHEIGLELSHTQGSEDRNANMLSSSPQIPPIDGEPDCRPSDERNSGPTVSFSTPSLVAIFKAALLTSICAQFVAPFPFELAGDDRHTGLDHLMPNVWSPGYPLVWHTLFIYRNKSADAFC